MVTRTEQDLRFNSMKRHEVLDHGSALIRRWSNNAEDKEQKKVHKIKLGIRETNKSNIILPPA